MIAINTPNAPEAIGPYVQGVNLGNMVITSGQLPINPETKAMPEDVAEQATFPARSCVEVARLPLDAKVEIEVIASQ
ncbi:hypothetical protein C9J12_03630 [Photobacterium frigidiphilum]|uniref:Reactive intermediate/imine deaminase n=1 Tax=Photobacterium frigidiphilum TaxID=264736 RepID=A0A2T3JPR8_9GAMM|nr:Rid family hydrolase [Photobacterium frigidiphilum]PSU51064.1 hypothetical protein C9J12_03630 [Photobacterium frigidiphilum]